MAGRRTNGKFRGGRGLDLEALQQELGAKSSQPLHEPRHEPPMTQNNSRWLRKGIVLGRPVPGRQLAVLRHRLLQAAVAADITPLNVRPQPGVSFLSQTRLNQLGNKADRQPDGIDNIHNVYDRLRSEFDPENMTGMFSMHRVAVAGLYGWSRNRRRYEIGITLDDQDDRLLTEYDAVRHVVNDCLGNDEMVPENRTAEGFKVPMLAVEYRPGAIDRLTGIDITGVAAIELGAMAVYEGWSDRRPVDAYIAHADGAQAPIVSGDEAKQLPVSLLY